MVNRIFVVNMILPIILGTIVAFLSVSWIYFKILNIALQKNLVDNPNARKLQKRPVPMLGGIAVFFGLLAGVMSGDVVHNLTGSEVYHPLLPICCAMMVMLYVGAMDDIMGLSPKSRFVIEILTVLGLVFSTNLCIDSLHGLWGLNDFDWWIGVPLTVLAGVGIINSINMIDGVNGLSSGLCIACCILFGISFILLGDIANAVLSFSMAGALMPFFLHNVFGEKSRMFIGDAGTMMMGILMTWFLICLLSKEGADKYAAVIKNVNMIALSIAILSVPIADTLRVMTMRMAKKKSPFQPDKTHLHHVFVNLGVSHFVTAMSEILIGLVIVAIWAFAYYKGASYEAQLYVVIVSAMFFVWGTYGILRYNITHQTEVLHQLTHYGISTQLSRKIWWKSFSAYIDGPFVNYHPKPIFDLQAAAELDNYIATLDKETPKEKDRNLILEFMKGKVEVYVDDILENSGAERLRVYPILFEEQQKGHISVVKSCGIGAPYIVALGSL